MGARARRRELGRGREGRAGVQGALARQEHAGRAACRLGRVRHAVGVRRALGARAGCKHAACAHLGVLARLCTWCTQPVFDPVSTQYCS